jgi:aminoglycoside phosphotransferase (APT) family kinase protein
MESTTKNRKTRQQIENMVARAFDNATLADGDDAIQELKDGWFNVAYCIRLSDTREVILKIAPPKEAEVMTYERNIMTTEVETMRLVAQNPAIPVPKIYYFDTAQDICDSDYFFMEKINGDNLEHVRASLPPEIQVQIDQHIGVIIREINQFTGTYFGYDGNPDLRGDKWRDTFINIMDSILDDGIRKNADYCGFSVDEIRATIQKHAPSLDEVTTPQLCHWDAWNPNIFVSDGKVVGIIDFERALWADPLIEAQFRLLAWEDVTESLKSYGKTTFTHAEDQRCHLYTLHLALLMKTECYYRNYETDYIKNIATDMMLPAMKWLMEN